jgi:hypothetical protein
MTENEICKKAYKIYVCLRENGFIEGQCLGIISQLICHLLMQSYMKETAEIKSLLEKI